MCRRRAAFYFCWEVAELAATRLIALHKNKGKSVAACLKSRTDYVQNPDKTQQGELVSSYECSPLTVDEEFMLSKRQYELMTGRRQKNDVIAYQIRQSFKPGEITAEEANKVGYELAMPSTTQPSTSATGIPSLLNILPRNVLKESTTMLPYPMPRRNLCG